MTFDNWIESGKQLVTQGTGHQFAIADWLLEGEERWEEKAYAKAEEVTGFTRQTLYDYVSTARAFPPESRRFASASFNHYRAVASVGDSEKRDRIMSQAGACTVRELRDKAALQIPKAEDADASTNSDGPITVTVPEFHRQSLNDLRAI